MSTKYQSGKIYKIIDNTSDMIYIGSTCQTLEQRLKGHEQQFKSFKAGKKIFVTDPQQCFSTCGDNNAKSALLRNTGVNNISECWCKSTDAPHPTDPNSVGWTTAYYFD